MGILLALLMAAQDLPSDAKQIVVRADAKLDALKKAYEKACAEVKSQELKELQRVYDATVKADPAGAKTIKEKVEVLSADVSIAGKESTTVEKWLQGKWIVMFQGSGDVMEFKGDKVIGSGIGDRTKGKIIVNESTIQIVWDSGYVETMRVSKTLGDEAAGAGRNGAQTFKRLK